MNKYNISFSGDWGNPSTWFIDNVTLYNSSGTTPYSYVDATHYSISEGITEFNNGGFDGCPTLLSITIPDEVTILGNGAFNYTTGLTSITLHDKLTTIGQSCFNTCSVKSLVIPTSVTSIGEYAFESSAIQELTLPLLDYPTLFYANGALKTIYANPLNKGEDLKAKLLVNNADFASLVDVDAGKSKVIELKNGGGEVVYPLTSVEAVYMPDGTLITDHLGVNAYTKSESDNKYVFKEVTDSIGPNLFDKNDSDIVVGYYLNTSNYNQEVPTFTSYPQYACTGYIPSTKGDFITSSYIAWESCGYFNADKEFIGTLRIPFNHEQPYTIEIGNNTPGSDRGDRMRDGYSVDDIAFIRINIKFAQTVVGEPYTSFDECMIVKGDKYPSQYIAFGESMPSKEVAPNLIITDNNLDNESISANKIKDIPTSKSVTFAGKSVLITGDSITEAQGFDGWVNNIRNICDFDNVYNDGKSGTGIITDFNSSVSIMDRYSTWEGDYGAFDYIVINGNMNDTKTVGFEIGLFDDPTTDMNISQYAACKALIEALLEQYPLKQIVWVISTPRRNSYKNTFNPGLSTDFAWGINSFFEPYCTAIKEVCAHYGVPVLDLYHESGLRPYNDTFNTTYFVSADGTHPNAEAQKIMTSKIIPFLANNLGENK